MRTKSKCGTATDCRLKIWRKHLPSPKELIYRFSRTVEFQILESSILISTDMWQLKERMKEKETKKGEGRKEERPDCYIFPLSYFVALCSSYLIIPGQHSSFSQFKAWIHRTGKYNLYSSKNIFLRLN